jgi:predicted GIY-YIG superfamily endonuclease
MSLNILEETYIEYRSKTEKAVKVHCPICAEDPELYGEAIYTMTLGNYRKGQKPCGCSKSPKRTEQQWEILIGRKALSNNHTFLGFIKDVDAPLTDQAYLRLHCNTCDKEWTTCNIANYWNDRGCPSCANRQRGLARLTSAEEWAQRFYATGQFDGYIFERQTPSSRMWNVICPACGPDTIFTSDRANLTAGKIPCNCKLGGGFNIHQKSYFYVLKITNATGKYCGYGITNYPERRMKAHHRELNAAGYQIEEALFYTGTGSQILELESHLKRTLERKNLQVMGFRKEATTIENFEKIIHDLQSRGFTEVNNI